MIIKFKYFAYNQGFMVTLLANRWVIIIKVCLEEHRKLIGQDPQVAINIMVDHIIIEEGIIAMVMVDSIIVNNFMLMSPFKRRQLDLELANLTFY